MSDTSAAQNMALMYRIQQLEAELAEREVSETPAVTMPVVTMTAREAGILRLKRRQRRIYKEAYDLMVYERERKNKRKKNHRNSHNSACGCGLARIPICRH